jgi:IS5 family transposase
MAGDDAVHPVSAALVQPVGLGGGGSPVGLAGPVPDETTICKFRHLRETHNLGGWLFGLIAEYLQNNGLKLSTGTIVDASIISAPSSTKNLEKQRDPEMHQTEKGNQWHVWHQGAHRGRQQDQANAGGGGDGGERA